MDKENICVEQITYQLVELYDKFASWEHSVVKGSGLSPSQMHTVEVIGQNRQLRMKELAERLGVTTGTLTIGIDKLEKKELVVRSPHEHDRRSWVISLTQKGQELYQQHHRFHLEYTREIIAELTVEECQYFTKVLDKIVESM